ncbi:hypothetical protein [Variovorax ginsengisoli]|uniref:Signal transduction histidine kinase dimerisation/phosphoacceptor domain-containing protein n=1 Tax=Variovorax ginsengisoli TaxID=363844 RepID=A0ABT9SF44_9BURK|nr:hypothetical protein [Variovorax ginsengisoli]MDP9902985.1 hypothetical protein [Variovorax ginsengisoli]
MKASPGARSWIAAGVRHELLTRALPALRHDMSAPVSVMRMGLLMLKRQVATATIDPAACQERVALIDSQIGELVSAVRSLRNWELSTSEEGITRAALVSQCVALMRPAFDLQGIRIEVDEAIVPARDTPVPPVGEAETEAPTWPAGAALRYLLLGALGFLQDSVDRVSAIRITREGHDGLCLAVVAHGTEGADAMAAHRAPRKLAIDAVAMQSLADDLGYTLDLDRDTVRFKLAAG